MKYVRLVSEMADPVKNEEGLVTFNFRHTSFGNAREMIDLKMFPVQATCSSSESRQELNEAAYSLLAT